MSPRAKAWLDQTPHQLSDDDQARLDAHAKQQAERKAEVERRRELKRHPVFTAIRNAASGSVLTEAELSALQLSPTHRHKVDLALAEVSAAKSGGENQHARDIADRHAFDITEGLPDEQSQADYLDVEVPDDRGPAELADAVQSW